MNEQAELNPGDEVWVKYDNRTWEGVVVREGDYPYEVVVRIGSEKREIAAQKREIAAHRFNVAPMVPS